MPRLLIVKGKSFGVEDRSEEEVVVPVVVVDKCRLVVPSNGEMVVQVDRYDCRVMNDDGVSSQVFRTCDDVNPRNPTALDLDPGLTDVASRSKRRLFESASMTRSMQDILRQDEVTINIEQRLCPRENECEMKCFDPYMDCK